MPPFTMKNGLFNRLFMNSSPSTRIDWLRSTGMAPLSGRNAANGVCLGAMARSRAEELWKGVQGLNVNFHGEQLRGVSASVGVAAYPLHGKTVPELMRAADTAMYAAKRAGRDRVETAQAVACPMRQHEGGQRGVADEAAMRARIAESEARCWMRQHLVHFAKCAAGIVGVGIEDQILPITIQEIVIEIGFDVHA